MREIKFRAWDRIGKRMLNWGEVLQLNLQNIFRNICGMTLLQYTGLKDRCGVEIYEGDIVKEQLDEDEYLYAEVVFENGIFKGKEFSHEPEYPIFDFIRGEVIGNIYENPELLEVERC